MKLTKELKTIIDDEIQSEIDILDDMSTYGTPRNGYTRREQCANIDGLKGLAIDFDTEQERQAYQIGLDRRAEIIEDYNYSKNK